MALNWSRLHFGQLTRIDIENYVYDDEWQDLRKSMKGKSLEFKYATLSGWLTNNRNCRAAQVQVTNYVNALKRGGLIEE